MNQFNAIKGRVHSIVHRFTFPGPQVSTEEYIKDVRFLIELVEKSQGMANEINILTAENRCQAEQIVRLRDVGQTLREYLTESGGDERFNSGDIPGEVWLPFIAALKSEPEGEG